MSAGDPAAGDSVPAPGDRVPRAAGGGLRFLLPLISLILVLPALRQPLRAQTGPGEDARLPSPVLLDPPVSPFAGTTSLQTAVRGVYWLEDRVLPLRLGQEGDVFGKALGIWYRLGRLTYLDLPVTALHAIVRHEVAGHGGRIRQFGAEVLDYRIDLPPPYGDGGGATIFDSSGMTAFERLTVFAGGLESTYLDARELEERWVARGRMDYREGLQYFYDLVEVYGYVDDARPGGEEPGHDVENYIDLVNASAPAGAPGGRVTSSSLADAAVVELLNPTLYYSLYSFLWRFLVQGEAGGPVPAPEIGAVRVMPSAHLRLTPYGPEHVIGGTAAWGGRVLRAGVRIGTGPRGGFGGVELEARRLWTGRRLSLGGRVGLWRQYVFAARSGAGAVGGMAVARGTLSFRGMPFSAVAELGGKSDGYVPGEALDAGAIVRVGFSAVF